MIEHDKYHNDGEIPESSESEYTRRDYVALTKGNGRVVVERRKY